MMRLKITSMVGLVMEKSTIKPMKLSVLPVMATYFSFRLLLDDYIRVKNL